jgi:hypothetical protein
MTGARPVDPARVEVDIVPLLNAHHSDIEWARMLRCKTRRQLAEGSMLLGAVDGPMSLGLLGSPRDFAGIHPLRTGRHSPLGSGTSIGAQRGRVRRVSAEFWARRRLQEIGRTLSGEGRRANARGEWVGVRGGGATSEATYAAEVSEAGGRPA